MTAEYKNNNLFFAVGMIKSQGFQFHLANILDLAEFHLLVTPTQLIIYR